MIEDKCMEPLSARNVTQRQGPGGSSLSYVDQHYVRRRLCEVFGPLGFDTETTLLERVSGPEKGEKGKWVTEYVAKVRLTVRDPETGRVAVREGTAAGTGEDRQLNWSVHCAVTEAETDALKRAAMQLGDSFGLALYDKQQEHVVSPAFEGAMRLVESGGWSKESGARIWAHLSAQEQTQVRNALAKKKAQETADAAE